MNIYPSTKVRPYVYICFDRETGQFYIGYREQNIRFNRTSDVDFPKYKTSSIYVRKNFDRFDWIILAEFENGDDAYAFEQQLIFENWSNPLLLNGQYRLPGEKKRFKSKKGRVKSADELRKISENHADMSGSKNPRSRKVKFIDPIGKEVICHGSYVDFVHENKLSMWSVNRALNGYPIHKTSKIYGWSVNYIDSQK